MIIVYSARLINPKFKACIVYFDDVKIIRATWHVNGDRHEIQLDVICE